ncbi:MAG: phosphate acyltransferase PlsX [Lachnospiraceae bacterium]|nr:phosphate acyltransferase PlsX [Lachnospiraceae bacterium]MBP5564787.1 phosphate acyltransferase PlsX [Lachnospiraceae bacterium]MBQ4275303.1 phosphate acyltransferase PlsX [Lachnospiraceae bacterium]
MDEMVKVALDAHGGDNAPDVVIQGAIDALNESDNLKIYLVGVKDMIMPKLESMTYDKERLEIVEASEIISMAEPPVAAIRKKKKSSIVLGMQMVRDKEADAFVSCGSTGAVLVGGQVIVGRIKGVDRPPLAPLIPTSKGFSLLIDCGANVDSKPSNLVQFAKMGSVYMEKMLGIENPTVGIVNIGAEEEKGNNLVKDTFPLLKNCSEINFIGSVEARDIPSGFCDVVVCDAFVGNVILKLYEGLGSTLLSVMKESMMSSTRGKIGGALVKPALKERLKSFTVSEYGGAPLLGLKGLVVKGHGNSTAVEIKNALLQCVKFKESDILNILSNSFTLTEVQEE